MHLSYPDRPETKVGGKLFFFLLLDLLCYTNVSGYAPLDGWYCIIYKFISYGF